MAREDRPSAREEKRAAVREPGSDTLFLEAVRARHIKAERDALVDFQSGNTSGHATNTRLANALAGVLDVLK